MTRFIKPGTQDYPDMAELAIKRALADANLSYTHIQQVFCGYVYGDSTCGQRAVYQAGVTGVPIVNVNNNCSTGSSALFLARQAIQAGEADCVLALGFEKMSPGSLVTYFNDRANPLEKHIEAMEKTYPLPAGTPFAPYLFGGGAREHMEKYGTTKSQLAKIAYKNHKHSVNNPYAQFRKEFTLDQIVGSPNVSDPLTKLQCCPTSDGAAAAVLVSHAFAMRHGLSDECVEIVGQAMATDMVSSFSGDKPSPMRVVGYDMTEKAAQIAYAQARITPEQINVAEVHDCFSANELITYEALGLCPVGHAGKWIDENKFTYGGNVVVNPSGGLISKGHPLGATGLAQCAELVWQLRGHAQKRQVKNASYGLQHNLGLGGACVVTIYKKLTARPALNSLNPDPAILEKWESETGTARPFAWENHCKQSKL
jgi:acetyl-CoA acetyltransferase